MVVFFLRFGWTRSCRWLSMPNWRCLVRVRFVSALIDSKVMCLRFLKSGDDLILLVDAWDHAIPFHTLMAWIYCSKIQNEGLTQLQLFVIGSPFLVFISFRVGASVSIGQDFSCIFAYQNFYFRLAWHQRRMGEINLSCWASFLFRKTRVLFSVSKVDSFSWLKACWHKFLLHMR